MQLREFARSYFTETFGGGMIPFDDAYWEAINDGHSPAYAQNAGVRAVVFNLIYLYEQQEA